MDFAVLEQGILKVIEDYGEKHAIGIDREFALLKLYEEVGEFAQAVLIHKKQARAEKHTSVEKSKEMMASELADIVGIAVVNARLFDIDLEKALQEKWLAKLN